MTPSEPKTRLLARDVMQAKVITTYPEMSLLAASKLFHDNKITGAPVVTKEGKLVGVISQSDLVRHRHRPGAVAPPASSGPYWNPEQAAGLITGQSQVDDKKTVAKVMSAVV